MSAARLSRPRSWAPGVVITGRGKVIVRSLRRGPVGELLCGMPTSVASLPTVQRLAVSSIVSMMKIVCERPSRRR